MLLPKTRFLCILCGPKNDFVHSMCTPKDFFVSPLCIPRSVVPAAVHKAPKFGGAENFPAQSPPSPPPLYKTTST